MGTFTADAWIAQSSDPPIRNQHDRRDHRGLLPSYLVELAANLGNGLTVGMTLDDALEALHERLVTLES